MSNPFWLKDAQMAQLQAFFPKSHGKPRVDDRPTEDHLHPLLISPFFNMI